MWQGLADELSKEGACEQAIFPDTNIVIARCAMIGNLSKEGVRTFFHFSVSLLFNRILFLEHFQFLNDE